MPYLLDTDIISATLKPRAPSSLLRRLARVPPGETFTSAITLSELLFGAIRRPRPNLLERIERIVTVMPVLPFDEDAARRYADIKADLEQKGLPLAEPDLRIAATALAAHLTLVTGNVRHFSRVPGLTVENWLTDTE